MRSALGGAALEFCSTLTAVNPDGVFALPVQPRALSRSAFMPTADRDLLGLRVAKGLSVKATFPKSIVISLAAHHLVWSRKRGRYSVNVIIREDHVKQLDRPELTDQELITWKDRIAEEPNWHLLQFEAAQIGVEEEFLVRTWQRRETAEARVGQHD